MKFTTFPVVPWLKLSATAVAAPAYINLKSLPLINIYPPTSCLPISYQYENQALPTTDQTAPRGSYRKGGVVSVTP